MQNKGIAFLLAIIISSIALSVGLGIAFVLLEELKLSSSNKDSFTSFFAADSGTDCALYWDFKEQSAIDSSASFFMWPSQGVLQCGNQIPALTITIIPNISTTTKFSIDLTNKCSAITVVKIGNSTIITSLGQNIACGGISNLRTVQRGIEVTY